MHVSLTDQLESLIQERVASGMYNNASEVVREALRKFFDVSGENLTPREIERIRKIVGPRLDALNNGTAKLLDSEQVFDDLEDELKE